MYVKYKLWFIIINIHVSEVIVRDQSVQLSKLTLNG